MHIAIAILILLVGLGLLLLATSKVGRVILGVLFLIVGLSLGAALIAPHPVTALHPQEEAQRRQQVCSKLYETDYFRSACRRDGP